MNMSYDTLRRTKKYSVVKEYFQKDPESTLKCLNERLIAHAQIIDIYEKEAKKILTNKAQTEQCMLGVKETIRSGKMIAKWIKKLRNEYSEYDFSIYPELMKVIEQEKLN